jgi:hypothetical protein
MAGTSAMLTMTVTIPACTQHEGMHAVRVTLLRECPTCGGRRGEPYPTLSYDGSRRLGGGRGE